MLRSPIQSRGVQNEHCVVFLRLLFRSGPADVRHLSCHGTGAALPLAGLMTMAADCGASGVCSFPVQCSPIAGWPLSWVEWAQVYWNNFRADYMASFDVPAPGYFVPRLFQVFDFSASLFTVIVFFVAGYSLLLHLRTLRLRHRLLRNIGAVELARLESQQ